AGSAAHSEIGSRLACQSFEEEVSAFVAERGAMEPLTREATEAWLNDFRGRITREAARLGIPVRDLACTFIGVIAAPSWFVACQVGDGAIVIDSLPDIETKVVTDGGDDFEVVFWPEQGEYANETYFATMPAASEHLRFRV